ncbi:hypothetical protein G6F53_014148 [Rhizopus delemar]|nr:hypothetical protein G6F53_014148 [Rhizopus delemar]
MHGVQLKRAAPGRVNRIGGTPTPHRRASCTHGDSGRNSSSVARHNMTPATPASSTRHAAGLRNTGCSSRAP